MEEEVLYIKVGSRYKEASDAVILGHAMEALIRKGLTSTVTKVLRDLFMRAGTEVERG